MYGWNGVLLRVDLDRMKGVGSKFGASLARGFLGGRGFAAKILWDELKPGVDPLSPENRLVFASGPLTGLSLPSSGKIVVAAKSPLTGGYGDGSLGTNVAVQMRNAGYDAIIVEGRSKNPVVLLVRDRQVEFLDGKDLWGLDSSKTEAFLKKLYGPTAGILCIGPAGEHLVKYANIVSQEGRGGGRPGMGAVMGSKNLKAVAVLGSGSPLVAFPKELEKLGADGYREVMTKPSYPFWKRQGTMMTIEWSQENSVLPTCNFSEGVFDKAEAIGGFAMEKIKTEQRGCPQCNMTCGNVVKDSYKKESELDYENVAMLGSNISLGNLKRVATLNRLADELGLDTISLGNVLGFAMEASEKRLIDEEVPWGKVKAIQSLVKDIAYRRGLGNVLAEGVRFVAERLRRDSARWAMHVKGLEISAYDCHSAPAMALAYATSSIGAHHKDAWVISWEVKAGRKSYSEAKVDKVIELQRVRGGFFEALSVCRLPWVELGLELSWYTKYLHLATGFETSWKELNVISDRIFTLIRAFWVREFGKSWNRQMDLPPPRWFDEPLSKGALKGAKLNRGKFDVMLSTYYKKRGWDQRGIPSKSTLNKAGLNDVAKQLQRSVKLSA